ncbi:hypothetical protein RS3R2_22500 [Pseudomonas lactis]|nr:hypothetical protein RS3R2_22500 [Pseudomonas lactis]
MLAKNVNDNACFLNERGAFEFFASKLAPTGIRASPAPTFALCMLTNVFQLCGGDV